MSVQNRINNIRCATHNCPDYKRIFNVSHINHLAPMASMNIIQVSHIIWTRLIIFHRLHFPYKTRANRDGAELNHVWQHFEICEFRSTEEEKKIYLKVLQREKEGALRGEMRWGMCKETWRTVPAMLSSSSSSPSEASSLLGGAGEEEDDENSLSASSSSPPTHPSAVAAPAPAPIPAPSSPCPSSVSFSSPSSRLWWALFIMATTVWARLRKREKNLRTEKSIYRQRERDGDVAQLVRFLNGDQDQEVMGSTPSFHSGI